MVQKSAATVTLEDLLSAENSKELVKGLSFEQGLKLLEELVARVESGQLPLDRAIASYERGAFIIEQLRALLAGAEEKIKLLPK
ncbi:MAG: exodeoxyribonuclease VII small subunit [Oligoflexia bacterium]|nr:exodeoxyribonuclease VII small subunit [Oligoflexia bacterium]